MPRTPVLPREEYIEQAYFFRVLRERLADGAEAQTVLDHLRAELLSSTRLPLAVEFMVDELRHSGELSKAVERLRHYFTPLQALILQRAEEDEARFTFPQGLLILEREAAYRAEGATPAGLFIFQFESVSRNRLGFVEALSRMLDDDFYDEAWREFILLTRTQLGERDLADLILARSEHFVRLRRQIEPDYQPAFTLLFDEREGRIAAANRGKDPHHLFATLQRQLGYPEVPRPPRVNESEKELQTLKRRLASLESKVEILEGEVTGKLDLSKFYVKPSPPAEPSPPPSR